MEPISLIISALVAGATVAAKDTAGSVVKDAYNGLKELIKGKFAGKPEVAVALEKHEAKPEVWKEPLAETLKENGADKDEEIIKLAHELLKRADPETAAKFNINATNIGVAGDHTTVQGGIHFGGGSDTSSKK